MNLDTSTVYLRYYILYHCGTDYTVKLMYWVVFSK